MNDSVQQDHLRSNPLNPSNPNTHDTKDTKLYTNQIKKKTKTENENPKFPTKGIQLPRFNDNPNSKKPPTASGIELCYSNLPQSGYQIHEFQLPELPALWKYGKLGFQRVR